MSVPIGLGFGTALDLGLRGPDLGLGLDKIWVIESESCSIKTLISNIIYLASISSDIIYSIRHILQMRACHHECLCNIGQTYDNQMKYFLKSSKYKTKPKSIILPIMWLFPVCTTIYKTKETAKLTLLLHGNTFLYQNGIVKFRYRPNLA